MGLKGMLDSPPSYGSLDATIIGSPAEGALPSCRRQAERKCSAFAMALRRPDGSHAHHRAHNCFIETDKTSGGELRVEWRMPEDGLTATAAFETDALKAVAGV